MPEIGVPFGLKELLGGIQVYDQSIGLEKLEHGVDFFVSQAFCNFRSSDVGKYLY